METIDKIKKIISDLIGVKIDDIELTSSLVDDFDIDSLDVMEITMSLEEEFEIKAIDEDVAKCKTVQDLLLFVENAIIKAKK